MDDEVYYYCHVLTTVRYYHFLLTNLISFMYKFEISDICYVGFKLLSLCYSRFIILLVCLIKKLCCQDPTVLGPLHTLILYVASKPILCPMSPQPIHFSFQSLLNTLIPTGNVRNGHGSELKWKEKLSSIPRVEGKLLVPWQQGLHFASTTGPSFRRIGLSIKKDILGHNCWPSRFLSKDSSSLVPLRDAIQ
ncbi:hypothetical protein VNO77_00350 [Canavalia gladiata]|uniref:Uncharacterized protein n=1 Tax=Canavalia gladiata TaxID=3824 RepID=A0AAN9MPV4_CANGL